VPIYTEPRNNLPIGWKSIFFNGVGPCELFDLKEDIFRAKWREIIEGDKRYQLREESPSYKALLGAENDDIGPVRVIVRWVCGKTKFRSLPSGLAPIGISRFSILTFTLYNAIE
jgi:hypothetical protein